MLRLTSLTMILALLASTIAITLPIGDKQASVTARKDTAVIRYDDICPLVCGGSCESCAFGSAAQVDVSPPVLLTGLVQFQLPVKPRDVKSCTVTLKIPSKVRIGALQLYKASNTPDWDENTVDKNTAPTLGEQMVVRPVPQGVSSQTFDITAACKEADPTSGLFSVYIASNTSGVSKTIVFYAKESGEPAVLNIVYNCDIPNLPDCLLSL